MYGFTTRAEGCIGLFESGRDLYTEGCGLHTFCMRADANGVRAHGTSIVIDTTFNGCRCDPCGGLCVLFESGRGRYTYGCDLRTVCMRADANGIRALRASMANNTTVNGCQCDPCGGLYRMFVSVRDVYTTG